MQYDDGQRAAAVQLRGLLTGMIASQSAGTRKFARCSKGHVEAWRVAEDEAIDAVLQVALCEVILAQPSCVVEAQRCQRVWQQGTSILIYDLREHCHRISPPQRLQKHPAHI